MIIEGDRPRVSFRLLARIDALFNRLYGSRYNPLYHSGALAIGMLAVLLATGLYLVLFYRIGKPYESVVAIANQTLSGRWIRSLHRFASDAVLLATLVHAFRMYAQRRTWGPRALAWLSGVALVGLILVCGWTGYVLVWDSYGLALAAEGARFLDALPFFSEPISRSFVGEAPLPSGFFFLNLFLHIALPLSLGLLLWVHVARVSRPVLLPTRRVLYSAILFLAVLALVWPAGPAGRADPLHAPTNLPIDLFYSFWLPLTQNRPASLAWLAAAITSIAVIAIPIVTKPKLEKLPAPAVVNEHHCTGCEQCVKDCPYDAIEMIASSLREGEFVASVQTDLCTSCGICVGSCPPMAIGPWNRTARDQLVDVREFLEREKPNADDVVIIGCTWSAAASEARQTGAKLFPVPCVGSIHSSTVEFMLKGGAGRVVVMGCPEHDGRTREGVTWTRERLFEGRKADLKERVDRSRIDFFEVGLAENVDLLSLCKKQNEEPS